MSLFSELINSTKVKPHKQFYGRYEILNSYNEGLSDQALFKLQMTRLKLMETSNSNFSYINDFFLNLESIISDEQSLLNTTLQQNIPARVMEILNSGLVANLKASGWKTGLDYSGLQQELLSLLGTSGAGLSTAIIQNLQGGIQSLNIKDQAGRWKYVQAKSAQAEQAAAMLLARDPSIVSLVTGQMVNEQGKQLIQDVMVFRKDIISDNKNMTVSFDGVSKIFSSIENFLNEMQRIKPKTITLTDEAYGVLKSASLFKMQVKSGNEQPILTRAARNNVSLQQIGGFIPSSLIELYNEACHLFKSQNSKTLAAWANYSLSKGILFTALKENDVYYTTDGFITASRWLELHKYLLKFTSEKIKLSSSFLTDPRPIKFVPLN